MSLNIELLRKVQKHILAHPEQVDMGTWGDCRTIGCIAFHAVRVDGESKHSRFLGAEFKGARALGIGIKSGMARELFSPGGIAHIYDDPGTPEHAQRVSDHIDRFIAKYGDAQ
jgi:hypothetical protein